MGRYKKSPRNSNLDPNSSDIAHGDHVECVIIRVLKIDIFMTVQIYNI